MIKRLEIQNYALIDALELDFAQGLTIITGETGAGKSILLGALGLIMGQRADTKVLYDRSRKVIVEGTFDVSAYQLQDFFVENDIDYEDELIVRREITPSGKSRAFVNDTPTNLKVLHQLSHALIDLHQQFDTLDIHEVSFQLRMLDALAGQQKAVATYQQQYRQYRQQLAQLQSWEQQEGIAARELDFANFQYQELIEAALESGEQEQLEGEQQELTHAETIKQVLTHATQQISEADLSVLAQLESVQSELSKLSEVKSAATLYEQLTTIVESLREWSQAAEDITENTDYDGERILEIQQRLDSLYRLQQKHQVQSIPELLEIQTQLEAQIHGVANRQEEMDQLRAAIAKKETALRKAAAKIGQARQKVIPDFERQITNRLHQLAMPAARVVIQLRPQEQLGLNGMDEVDYLFSANKGSDPQPIKAVASGGELSRLTLVTKSLVASAIPLPTLIFDEIDAGVSGDVALKMGSILGELSDEHQVVVITHSPQVAAQADTHYFIYKVEQEERTITKVRALNTEERVRAIATMLSQNPPSASAIENARELLKL